MNRKEGKMRKYIDSKSSPMLRSCHDFGEGIKEIEIPLSEIQAVCIIADKETERKEVYIHIKGDEFQEYYKVLVWAAFIGNISVAAEIADGIMGALRMNESHKITW